MDQQLTPQACPTEGGEVVGDRLEVAEVTGDQTGLRQHHDVRAPRGAGAERGVVAEWYDLDGVLQFAETVEHLVEGAQLLTAPAHSHSDAEA